MLFIGRPSSILHPLDPPLPRLVGQLPRLGGLWRPSDAARSVATNKEVRVARGYWVAFADVSDPEGYKAYIAENAKAFRKYGGRFLTRGGKSETPEGRTRSRAVVIEFPTYAAEAMAEFG